MRLAQSRYCWTLVLLAFVLVTAFPPAHCANSNSVVVAASDDDDSDAGDTIQANPAYEEPNDDVDESDGSDCDDDDEEGEEESDSDVPSKKATKSILSKALAKPKKAAQLAKKHKTKIIMILLVYAFRKELANVFFKLVSVPVYDPTTGKLVGRSLSINPTSILKLLFFLKFMWQTFRPSESSSPTSLLRPTDAAAAAIFPRIIANAKSSVYVPPTEQHWTFERVNERYDKDGLALQKAMGETASSSSLLSSTVSTNAALNSNGTNCSTTATAPAPTPAATLSLAGLLREMLLNKGSTDSSAVGAKDSNGTVIIMDLTKLSTTVVQMELIRDQVSFLLTQHRANQTRCCQTTSSSMDENNNNTTVTSSSSSDAEMEIVILLESPGGGAADYGLAAQQLMRLRNQAGIKLTICVDKVAASGGYMMAAVGHEILAAPFAVLGSIGVYGQTINVHDVLEGWGVKDLIFRAGKNKAPLGLIGEVTTEGRNTIQAMIDDTHVAFKYHIATVRPALRDDIDEIATGAIWLGYNALDRGLVDRLLTSDEYIDERMEQGAKVLKLIRYRKPHFGFGPRSSEYSVSALVRSVAAHLKHFLIGSVEESDSINARSLSAHLVQTKSPIT
mmetsp:Transcript_21964/g.36344  ORF Transcript_21964/g.36344 Transcript_21964/m.36344 type:complete len:618 (-) Transcript_21964:1490-3343(-)|eukprot:CAMPEP_0119011846 /NCGR_PEP_ID=MMETSP1176-20130426/5921_1 /TAXON_ID=265551 /ORGANISM="Synedropsis recta cf, Strain CCMP1620" /LENGTH=617 /DNA_ID=CAMNT_0006964717 /DNA_START=93 /DNA_END=1946 /DNA_ORIENTATION=-